MNIVYNIMSLILPLAFGIVVSIFFFKARSSNKRAMYSVPPDVKQKVNRSIKITCIILGILFGLGLIGATILALFGLSDSDLEKVIGVIGLMLLLACLIGLFTMLEYIIGIILCIHVKWCIERSIFVDKPYMITLGIMTALSIISICFSGITMILSIVYMLFAAANI